MWGALSQSAGSKLNPPVDNLFRGCMAGAHVTFPGGQYRGAIDTLHLYPQMVLFVALHITDRTPRDGIVATPFGDLFNHLRHGPDDDVQRRVIAPSAPPFAEPFQALERLAS